MPSTSIAIDTGDRSPAGRPAKFGPAIADRLVQAFRLGSKQVSACNYAGISQDTFRRWQKQVQSQDPNVDNLEAKTKLFDDIAKAVAELQAYHLALIEKAAQNEWRAAAWKLERRFPRDWGQRTQIELDAQISDAQNQPAEIVHQSYDLSKLSDEQLDQVMALLEGVKSEYIEIIDTTGVEVTNDDAAE